jgi:putative endonuclease
MKDYFVYIVTNKDGTVLYIGMTNNLERRIYEHKNKLIPGFTAKYNLDRLVYFEQGNDVTAVIAREKELKGWLRSKKKVLITSFNPQWRDLSADWQPSRDSSLRSE